MRLFKMKRHLLETEEPFISGTPFQKDKMEKEKKNHLQGKRETRKLSNSYSLKCIKVLMTNGNQMGCS